MISKSSGEINEVEITHEGNDNSLSLLAGYFENGSIWQIMEPHYFGSLDVKTGVFTPVSADSGWSQTPILREPDGKYLFWVTTNVWRYHTTDNTYVPLVNRKMDVQVRAAMDSEYVYCSTDDDYDDRPADPIGLVRVKKP